MNASLLDAAAPGEPPPPPTPRSRGWQAARRVAGLAFLGLIAWLIWTQAQRIEWHSVGDAMLALPWPTIALAGLLALASHALYSTFDLFGRHVVGHHLGVRPVMTVTQIAYAFGLNFGSLIGALALRYRLYARLGLGYGDTTRVVTLALATNWLGYLMLGGLAFLLSPLALPPEWRLDGTQLRWLGAAMVVGALAYLLLCGFSPRRHLSFRGRELELPSGRLALLQLGVSMLNWSIMGTIVWVLLQRQLPWPAVLTVLMVAAVAGVITHVPAGLGVLEAVFMALLGHRMPTGELLGGLLAYRVLYYLVPLAVASVVYFVVEARARRIGDAAKRRRAQHRAASGTTAP